MWNILRSLFFSKKGLSGHAAPKSVSKRYKKGFPQLTFIMIITTKSNERRKARNRLKFK